MNADPPELIVVMPVYNEQEAISQVVESWTACLQPLVKNYRLLVIDDGSTDKTSERLEKLCSKILTLDVIRQANRGHGPSCLAGYRHALARGASWVLQLDSDGQCDPAFFPHFWQKRDRSSLIFGQRIGREDGHFRSSVSFGLRSIVYLATGSWIKDPNVPYRLMRAASLRESVTRIPPDAYFANVLVSYLLQQAELIEWLPILFRRRISGTSRHSISRLFGHARMLYCDLRKLKETADGQ